MTEYSVKTIVTQLKFPEGPVFDFDGKLWFVEISGGTLSRWDGNKIDRFDVNGTPNGATRKYLVLRQR